MLIKITYPNYVSALSSFVFCSLTVNEFEILKHNFSDQLSFLWYQQDKKHDIISYPETNVRQFFFI